jgi:dTDP-4-dehydrorhamnose 3,5-epimerase
MKSLNQMRIEALEIPELKLIVPKRFEDTRGNFQESWSDRAFREKVEDVSFVQDNRSFSIKKGTLRGLHFQRPPRAQGKLVQVLEGAILDVAVDIRCGSPTYGRHVSIRLDAKEDAQLWIPAGFLHGFCTLVDQTTVFYKVTDYYSQAHDAGVIWNDPDLGIDWPMDDIVLSEKDQNLPRLRDLPAAFNYADMPRSASLLV